MKNKRLLVIIFLCLAILLIPFVAMQFTNEVNWSLFDFLIAAILLFGTGLIIELVLRKINYTNYSILFVVAILITLLIIWAELAVGIFGTPIGGS